MCGISGIIACEIKMYSDQINKMNKALRHRGPDDSGIVFFNNGVLAHTRLSIVDLECGKQPMTTKDCNVGITFNGEIYGYRDIKKDLSAYYFTTASDTEVILALYEKYGTGLLDSLPGMFSFAIWDDINQTLFCARDRFGEKPFYYSIGRNGEFIFSSEIKGIIASGLIKPILNEKAIPYYLKHLYIDPKQTIYSNIFTLPPAHFLVLKNGKISIERYWNLPEINEKISMNEAVEEFRRLFFRSVKNQLIADVPIGTFLSGGLDSATVVSVASTFDANIKTLSFGFNDYFNELPYAKEIASLYKTDHFEMVDTDIDVGELLLLMQDIYDEPFADSSNIPTYLISKHAKKHVKAVLTGDGGDELLAGYEGWYRPLLNQSRNSDMLSKFISKTFTLAANVVLNPLIPVNSDIKNRIERKYISEYGTLQHSHIMRQSCFTDTELLDMGIKKVLLDKRAMKLSRNRLEDILNYDIENYMVGDILTKTDRASMANGLELRAPFLDVDFASFCISLPTRLKISNEQEKVILRQAFSKMWTPSIQRRSKVGFGAPVDKWLKRDSVKQLKEYYLNNPDNKIFSLLSYKKTQNIIKNGNYQTWILLVLAIWMDKHLV